MIEKLIEAEGTKYAEARGWLVYKWSSPGKSGILDRLYFKNGVAFALEFKTTGKKATPKQRAEAERLQAAGIPCRCCDTVAATRSFIDDMEYIATCEYESPLLCKLVDDLTSFK